MLHRISSGSRSCVCVHVAKRDSEIGRVAREVAPPRAHAANGYTVTVVCARWCECARQVTVSFAQQSANVAAMFRVNRLTRGICGDSKLLARDPPQD